MDKFEVYVVPAQYLTSLMSGGGKIPATSEDGKKTILIRVMSPQEQAKFDEEYALACKESREIALEVASEP
ncbi:MAG: hypothetical protein EB060_08195 [Proteobacteria bacterium]|nr:hypothetical protein [Pseudomonadota bacterium]